jgi:predicted transcriptional regulator
MKVLLSIKPEFAEKILLGEKKFEFRKVLPKSDQVTTIVIYATMPLGKVVGEFDVGEILTDTPQKIWRNTKECAGITKKYFNEYFEGRDVAHAIGVKAVRRYKNPESLSKILPGGVAPQSFCYI